MAKVTPSVINGAYASTAELNANFSLLAAEFENALSLDGTTPNQMLADFDMNNQDILNAGNVYADTVITTSLIYEFEGAAASDIGIVDAGGHYDSLNVEDALQEVAEERIGHDGTNVQYEVVVWDSSTVGKGYASFTYNGTTLQVDGDISIGADGEGDSVLDFYDDTNDVKRSIFWDDSEGAFFFEDSDGNFQQFGTGTGGGADLMLMGG